MKRSWLYLLLLLGACGPSVRSRGADLEHPAFEAFRSGDFERARSLLTGATDPESRELLGRILLLQNRGTEAAQAFYPLVSDYPPFGSRKAQKYDELQRLGVVYPLLAFAYLRADDFTHAALIYRAMGEQVLERKYDALGRSVGYLSTMGDSDVVVPLLGIDPLPHVSMTVNGHTGVFLVDTALDEIILELDFAKRLRLSGHGIRTNDFRGRFDESTVEEVGIGRLQVRNVPVHLGHVAPVGGFHPDGAIGLSFLLHFDFTLDYRKGRLVLRKPGQPLAGGLPAVLAGDRYLLVQGSVNGKAGRWVALNSAMPDVLAAGSEGTMATWGGVKELALGAIRLVEPPVDPGPFPTDLDAAFGFPVPVMLAHQALRDHAVRVEPRSMRVTID
jgi:hypothetical protein